jgi:hypothetical protein
LQGWTQVALGELHLFLVVATDANRSAALLPGVGEADAIGTFFQRLANTQAQNLLSLIAGYAEQDAMAAFRVATLCGINILERLPQIVVQNIDQPPFLAMVLQHAAESQPQSGTWAALFAEAGLRSAAAAALLSEESEELWGGGGTLETPLECWTLPNFIPPSLYSFCLKRARSVTDLDPGVFALLPHFKPFPAPSSQPNFALLCEMCFAKSSRRYLGIVFLCPCYIWCSGLGTPMSGVRGCRVGGTHAFGAGEWLDNEGVFVFSVDRYKRRRNGFAGINNSDNSVISYGVYFA